MTTLTQRLRYAWAGLTGSPARPRAAKPAGRGGTGLALWPNVNRQPVWTPHDLQSFVDYGFNLNAVIYAACMYRADAVNTARLRAYRGEPDAAEALPHEHPLARLLLRPNPFQSAYEFHALNSVYFALAGQSFVWFRRPRPGALPTSMYTLRPDWVKIVPGADDGEPVVGYVYVPEGKALRDGQALLPEDVMHVKRPNPGDPLMGAGYGYSPMAPLAQSANVDNDVTKFLKVFFQSGAMFQNAVSFEGPQEPEALAAVREKLKELYGGVENWADWAVFDSGAKVQRVSPTFDEMGFEAIDSRNEARMLMALGVPPILVGSRFGLERSTYSNYEEARKAFWEDRLLPEMRLFENEYQFVLNSGQEFVKYDFSDAPALRRDVPALAEAAHRLWQMGVPARMAFTATGLEVPEYEGDEQSYVNVDGGGQTLPASTAPTAEDMTAQVEQAAARAPAKARKAYDAESMGRKMDTLAVDWEQRYGDQANALFEEERRALSAMLHEMQQDAYQRKGTPRWKVLTETIEEWYAKEQPEAWRSAFVPLVQGTMTQAGQEWAAALGVAWNVRPLAGEAWFQEYMLKFAQPITQTSSDSVKAVIAQAMAEGWTIPQTDERLGLVFQQWMQGDLTAEDFKWFEQRLPPYRREAISRTESIKAASQGSLNLGKSWGARRKFWIGTADDRSRDTHSEARGKYAENKAIPIDDKFIVGGHEMNAPGDPSAPVEEIVNCRCTLGLLMD